MSLLSPPLVSHLSPLPARGRFHAWALAVPVILGAMVVLAQPAAAGTVTITVSGSVASADPGMGYAVGDPVSFFWELSSASPAVPPGSVTPNDSYWEDNGAPGVPLLFASVGGTGIAGTYQRAVATYDYVWAFATGQLEVEHDENGDGLYLAADPSAVLRYVAFDVVFSKPGFAGFIPDAVLPNPVTYFAGYAGTYAVDSYTTFELQAGSKIAHFVPLSMTIAPTSTPVPEISQAGLAGATALLVCGLGLIERRRRNAFTATSFEAYRRVGE